MRKMRICLALTIAALCPALMAPTPGGLPSAPTFQKVGIGASPAGTASGQLLSLSHTNAPYFLIRDSDAPADTKNAYIQNSNGDVNYGFCNDAIGVCNLYMIVSRNTGTNVAGTINLQATSVQVNGSPIPKFMAGRYSIGAGGCTASGGTQIGHSGCSRGGVGSYTVTLNITSTSAPQCTSSLNQSGMVTRQVISGSSGAWTLLVETFLSTTGAQSDSGGLLFFTCMAI